MMKSKKHRQAWWNGLSGNDQTAYLEKVQARKAEKRRQKSMKLMKDQHYDCTDCIHGRTNSCTDNLPNGCEYYSSEITGESGPAYKRTA
jgi:hypothetical protein